MAAILLTAPAAEPLSVVDAKAFLRVEHDDDDAIIAALSFVIDAAVGVIAAPGWSLSLPGRAVAGIELDVVIGFGATAANVPQVLLQAIRMLVAHWYENRSLVAIGQTVAMLPPSVNAMIASHRVLSL